MTVIASTVVAPPGTPAPSGPAAAGAPPASGRPRRRLRGTSGSDAGLIAGALFSAVCVSGLLFGNLTSMSGLIGFAVVTYAVFLGLYALLIAITTPGAAVADKLASVVLTSAGLVLLAALILVVSFTLWRGHVALFHANFFTQDLSSAGPLAPVTVGGVAHAIIGTLWMIGIALAITVPLGLVCAVYLTQVGGRGSRFIRTVVEAMTALPSIVAGLFIYATWVLILGNQRSGFAAALALSTMMLPIIIRSADVVLRLVPGNLKEASQALGAPAWRTVAHVVLPTARSGLVTSVILGTARGIGETSPVLLTAGYTAYLNADPLHGPMVSLPLAVFDLVRSPQQAYIQRGFAAAALLMLLVLALFVIARVLGRAAGQSRSQLRRASERSARDAARMMAGGAR